MLVGLELGAAGNFSDIDTIDTHLAHIDWGDDILDELGSTTGGEAATHIYNQPGE